MELTMDNPQVLVVGAGPAGLVTAITLGRQGIRTLVIEKRSTTSPFPRATGISLRSMEQIRSWGIEAAVRAGEMDVGTTSWIGGPIASGQGMPVSLGFPTHEEARQISPTTSAAVPQDHLEPVLIEHLRGYPSVEVRFDTELVALSGTCALVRTGDVTDMVQPSYVVGADGAHSAVRAAVGIALEGPDDLAAYHTVLFRAPLPKRHALYMVQHPEAGGVLLPTDNVDRWVYSQPYDPATQQPLGYSPERLIRLIRTATGVDDLPVEIERLGSFTFAAQVATSYRRGNVFLVGDAAHRITPRGGTGMNTAIQDGLGLGWRLAWALRGWAGLQLLDMYEEERRPVGIRNTARSAVVGPRDNSQDYLDDLAGRIPHVWLQNGQSTLDLIGDGLTLLTGPSGRAWCQAVSEVDLPVPVEVRGVDARAAEVLGIGRQGAILVRPDAIPVADWPHPDPESLYITIKQLTA
jgi:putative polyketide hydroxylase